MKETEYIVKKVTFKEEPTLFDDITEFAIDSIQDHRRGSNFFREDIIEFNELHRKYFPEVKNFEHYFGTWKTNCVIWDSDYGFDEGFTELTRVTKKEIITYEWKDVE